MINIIKMFKKTKKEKYYYKTFKNSTVRKQKKANSLSTLLKDLKQEYNVPSNCCETLQSNKI